MKQEYDFSKAERGKFFKENARLNIPIYLDAEVQAVLEARAADKGVALSEIVNSVLRREIAAEKL